MSYTVSRDVALPGIDPGDYFILFETNTNSGQGETDTSNNLRVEPISIGAPNLTVVEATAPASGLVNEIIDISYRVFNDSTLDGARRLERSSMAFRRRNTRHPSDQFLGSVSIEDQTPLAGGADYTIDRAVTLPKDSSGEKFLLFVANANNGQGETNHDDNTRSRANLNRRAAKPDCQRDSSTRRSWLFMKRSWCRTRLLNTGTTPAVGNWQDILRLYERSRPSDQRIVRRQRQHRRANSVGRRRKLHVSSYRSRCPAPSAIGS